MMDESGVSAPVGCQDLHCCITMNQRRQTGKTVLHVWQVLTVICRQQHKDRWTAIDTETTCDQSNKAEQHSSVTKLKYLQYVTVKHQSIFWKCLTVIHNYSPIIHSESDVILTEKFSCSGTQRNLNLPSLCWNSTPHIHAIYNAAQCNLPIWITLIVIGKQFAFAAAAPDSVVTARPIDRYTAHKQTPQSQGSINHSET